ncbi:uncharacterized protein LOC144546535 [Carex rostrata]
MGRHVRFIHNHGSGNGVACPNHLGNSSRSREFTVKRAYQMLFEFRPRTDISQSECKKKLWTAIWNIQGTIPKIKFFIWKAIQGPLPSASNLAKWISKIAPECGICGIDQEDAEHILFHFPHARATWFQSSLGLRTDTFEGLPIKEILTNLWSVFDQSKIALFLSIAWQVWKSRCSHLFDSKRVKPDNTLMAAVFLDQAIKLTKLPCNMVPITVPSTLQGALADTQQHCHVCYLDGSFNQPDKGGAAYLIYLDEELIRYETICKTDAFSPFQMEAFALLSAINQGGSAVGNYMLCFQDGFIASSKHIHTREADTKGPTC